MVQNKVEKYRIDIIRNPTTVKLLASQIKTASDAYISLQMNEKEYQELMLHYAKYHGKKLFSTCGSLNPTVRNRIGSKRCELVELMLQGLQTSML